MYRLSDKCTSRGEREKGLAEHSGVTRYICATVHWQIVLSLICFLAPEDNKQNVWYDTFCTFRREDCLWPPFWLPCHMGSHMQKWSMINFYALSPHRKCTRQTQENLGWRGVHSVYCCKQAKQPVILSSSTPKTQLSQVRSEAWVEKIKSHAVSLSFPKGSNCSVFSNFIPLFPRFLFPLGARHFFSTHWTPFSYLWGGA